MCNKIILIIPLIYPRHTKIVKGIIDGYLLTLLKQIQGPYKND